MEFALITMNKIGQMFVILLVGYLAFKLHILDNASNKRLSGLLTKIISPFLVFMSYQMDFDAERLKGLLITLALAFLTHFLSIAVAQVAISKKASANAEIERFSLVYSNCGFIGIPLISAIYGSEGIFYMTAYITVYNILVWSHGLILMCGSSTFLGTIKKCMQPATFAIALGILFFVLQIRIPAILSEPISQVGSMNTPVAMIVAGCNLAESDLMGAMRRLRSYYISFLKLILIPILCILVMKFIPVSEVYVISVLVGVSCPVGAMGTMLALQYDKNSNYATELFAITTILSLITIPFVMMVMGFLL